MRTILDTAKTRTSSLLSEKKQPYIALDWLRRTLKMIVWTAICSVVAIFALEGILLLINFGEQEYVKVDPVLGLVHLENKMVTWRAEGYSHERTNSVGFCDSERNLAKDAAVTRIAIFGDSFTEALQVPLSQKFTQRLQSDLNHNSASKFEVLNCGVSGFGTGQEYLLYLNKVTAYKPDITILCINQWEADKNTVWPTRPTFSFGNNDQLKVSWTNFDKWCISSAALPFTLFDWGRRESRVWGVLLQAYRDLQDDKVYKKMLLRLNQMTANIGSLLHVSRAKQQEQVCTPNDSATKSAIHLQRQTLCAEASLIMDDFTPEFNNDAIPAEKINHTGTTNSAEEHWKITKAIVEQFARKCSMNHSRLVLVVIPVKWQTDPLKEKFESLAKPDKELQIPILNTIPTFACLPPKQLETLFLEGHFSSQGHGLLANLISKFLRQSQLLDRTK